MLSFQKEIKGPQPEKIKTSHGRVFMPVALWEHLTLISLNMLLWSARSLCSGWEGLSRLERSLDSIHLSATAWRGSKLQAQDRAIPPEEFDQPVSFKSDIFCWFKKPVLHPGSTACGG